VIFLFLHIVSNPFLGGDASMELTMAAQEDATPWDLSLTGSSTSLVDLSPCTAQGLPNSNEPILHGR
jgi:hypothetical protein